MHSTRTPIKPAPVNANVMCVMAQNQDHRARSEVLWPRQHLELNTVEISGLVPGNKKSAGAVAVAVSGAGQLVSIGASGKGSVVATPTFGFGRAVGGTSNKMRAAHITKPSTGRGVTFGPAKPGWFCGRAG
jgi:hypothetical protein